MQGVVLLVFCINICRVLFCLCFASSYWGSTICRVLFCLCFASSSWGITICRVLFCLCFASSSWGNTICRVLFCLCFASSYWGTTICRVLFCLCFASSSWEITICRVLFCLCFASSYWGVTICSHSPNYRRIPDFAEREIMPRTTFVLQKSSFQAQPLEEHSAYYVCTPKEQFQGPTPRRAFRVLRLYSKRAVSEPDPYKSIPRTTFVLQKSSFQAQPLEEPSFKTIQNHIQNKITIHRYMRARGSSTFSRPPLRHAVPTVRAAIFVLSETDQNCIDTHDDPRNTACAPPRLKWLESTTRRIPAEGSPIRAHRSASKLNTKTSKLTIRRFLRRAHLLP